ncbi:hypothetical protein ACQGFJ_15640 [Rhodococcus sp. 3.70]
MGITVQTRNDGAQLKRRRALVAGSVGNFIEWYEFGVYGFFATIIASNFFSADGSGDLESLIKTYASFALAFSSAQWGPRCSVDSVTASADVPPW